MVRPCKNCHHTYEKHFGAANLVRDYCHQYRRDRYGAIVCQCEAYVEMDNLVYMEYLYANKNK